MQPTCHSDRRRDAVRRTTGRNGIDFVETGDLITTNVCFGGAYLTARFTRAELTPGLKWSEVFSASVLAGVGFTVALLIADLAFADDPALAAVRALVRLDNQRSASAFSIAGLVPAEGADDVLTLGRAEIGELAEVRPGAGGPSSSGTSSSEATTERRPPTSPTVSRSPARVERRMIAHASCPCSASIAARASVVSGMGPA